MATRVEMAEIAMGTGKAQYFDGRYGDGDGDGDGDEEGEEEAGSNGFFSASPGC